MMILSARMAPLLVALSFLYLLALIRPHYTHVLTDTRTSQEHGKCKFSLFLKSH